MLQSTLKSKSATLHQHLKHSASSSGVQSLYLQKHFSQSISHQNKSNNNNNNNKKKEVVDDDTFSTAFDLDEHEVKDILKSEASLGTTSATTTIVGGNDDATTTFDPTRHYDVDAVLPKIAKNVKYERTDRLIRALKAKVTPETIVSTGSKIGGGVGGGGGVVGDADDGSSPSSSSSSTKSNMYWRMYNRERQRQELSNFQQQLEEFPDSIYGRDVAGRADVEMMTQAVQQLADKQLGIANQPTNHVFDTLAKVETEAKENQDTDEDSSFSFLMSTKSDEMFVEPWMQQDLKNVTESSRVSRVFQMLNEQLKNKRLTEGKQLYDEEVKKRMMSDEFGSPADYMIPVVGENVVAEAKKADALTEPKYGAVVTKSSRNVDITSASASPTSMPASYLKQLTHSHLRHVANVGDSVAQRAAAAAALGDKDALSLNEDEYLFNENHTSIDEQEMIDNPASYKHQETRYFLNDEHFGGQFEQDLRNDLKTKPLEQIYREKPYLLLDPLAMMIREMNNVSAEELAAPFDRTHLRTLYQGVLQGRPLSSIAQFFQSISEVTDRAGLLTQLQSLLPNFSRTKIDSILGKIISGLVQESKTESLLETKHYSGTKRSVMALTDLLNGNSQPGNMSMSDLLARPMPKIESVMYAVDQIAKAQVEERTLQLVAELGKTYNEKDYASEWDYLYEVLKPIHSASKLSTGAVQGRRRYQPQIYSGIVRASGTRKDSRAHVVMTPGTGIFCINGRNYLDYFKRRTDLLKLGLPFKITQTFQQFDIYVKAQGGGTTGQRDAIKLAISKAFAKFIPEFGYALSANSMMTVDMRHVERKKFGLVKARKRATFVKR